tara:strand:+ start:317 stop:940 length:624 start_codon:yes stop_codon:yes gene_type:complete
MILELLASASFILWFTIVAVITIIISLENNKEGLASGIVSLVLALILWNYGRELWEFVSTNVFTTIYFSVGYIILGVVWSFIKWNELIKQVFREIKLVKINFEKIFGEITYENLHKFTESLGKDIKGDKVRCYGDDTLLTIITKFTPVGIDNKTLIISWISYWPLSMVGTILNNPFRRLFELIFNQVSGMYDKITKNRQNDVFGDLK